MGRRKQLKQERGNRERTRREFLRFGGIGLGVAGLAGLLVYGSRQNSEKVLFVKAPLWNDEKIKGQQNLEAAMARSAKIKGAGIFYEGEREAFINSLMPRAALKLQQRGIDPGKCEFKVSLEYFAVTESEKYRPSQRNYVLAAHDFLKSEIKGISLPDLEFVFLPEQQKNAKDLVPVYVGNRLLRVRSLSAFYKNQGVYARVKTRSLPGYVQQELYPDAGKVNVQFGFLGSGEIGVLAPFSELIPMATSKKSITRYTSNLEFRQQEEALSEGISYHLAKKLLREMGVKEGDEIVERSRITGEIGPTNEQIYKFVEPSIAWLGRNSLQAGFDLYMEDPRKYISAISK